MRRPSVPGADLAGTSVLATDYDGTLAAEGRTAATTLAAVDRWQASGRKALLVTGRQLRDLAVVFPEHVRFDAVVAENGAVFQQLGEAPVVLGDAPPPAFIDALARHGAVDVAVGQSVVATPRGEEPAVMAALAELRLPWRVILNKDSLMCLPPGIDKGAGLFFALGRLGLAPAQTVGVGDAENDLDFLRLCGVFAVVANALPELTAAADVVAPADAGAGVAWLIDRLLANDVSPPAWRTAMGRSGG